MTFVWCQYRFCGVHMEVCDDYWNIVKPVTVHLGKPEPWPVGGDKLIITFNWKD